MSVVEQQPRVQQFVDSLRSRQAPGARPTVRMPMSVARAGIPQQPIFDPQMLTQLGRLEVIARTVVDGSLSGKHRSTHKGGCTDFAEYRPYTQGDDIRQLDWKKYAKTDRYYVKRYDDETNMQALLIADASGSMQFGMSTVTKWRYAQMAAACLGHLLLRQRDSVGLAVVGDRLHDYVKPLPRANHLSRVINVLERIDAAGKSKLDESLQDLTGRLKRRGMVLLLSDCFTDVPKLKHVLEQFRLRGHDVLVFQILAPEELDFPFRRESFFQDLELPRRIQVNPNTLRKQYLAEFRAFREQLQNALTDIGADLVTFRTDQDLGAILAKYLRHRAAQKTATLARTR
jgi:uncharacterized protein (DUF58 family)